MHQLVDSQHWCGMQTGETKVSCRHPNLTYYMLLYRTLHSGNCATSIGQTFVLTIATCVAALCQRSTTTSPLWLMLCMCRQKAT